MRPPRRASARITSKEARDPLNRRLGAFGAKPKAVATVAPTTNVYIIGFIFAETRNKQKRIFFPYILFLDASTVFFTLSMQLWSADQDTLTKHRTNY
jgi:hypothetical protein